MLGGPVVLRSAIRRPIAWTIGLEIKPGNHISAACAETHRQRNIAGDCELLFWGSVRLTWGRALGDDHNSPGDFRYWTQSIDGTLYGCWYRLRTDGQIEVFARGHRVTLPLDAIALLPESVARALLAQLRQPAGSSEHVGRADQQVSFESSAVDNVSEAKGSLLGEAAQSPLKPTELASSPADGTAPVGTEIGSAKTEASD